LVPRSKNTSVSATQICTPVRRGRHGKISSPCTPISSGRARLPNTSRHQKVSSSKLAGNRHPLGWRHFGRPRTHNLRRILCYDHPNEGCRPKTLEKLTSPPGGPQPTRMEQRPKLALRATFGRRTFTLTGCARPCNVL
jgi:hypothetical protein